MPWYRQPWVIVLAVIFYPLGLLLMWRYAPWYRDIKWSVTIVAAALTLGLMSYGGLTLFIPAAQTAPTPTAAVAVVAATPTATATQVLPTATATPPPPTPTPTPQPVAAVVVNAWMSNPNPPQNSRVTTYVQVTRAGAPVAGASVYLVAHFRTIDERWPGSGVAMTGADGVAPITYPIGRATLGYPVRVEVFATVEGTVYNAETSFTPN